MLVPIVIALAAVALGLGFGLAPPGLQRVVGPLRTFALSAALAVAGTHLLPEAFGELGPAGVAVFALGLALPSLTRLGRSLFERDEHDHEHAHDGALEFGYVGLLVHHVADGMGLGAYGRHDQVHTHGHAHGHEGNLDVLLALAVHTVPLVAVITLLYRARGGVRAAVWRSAGLALASVVGVLISASVSEELSHHFSAWVAAGVAGLLVHVVTHDLERDLPTTHGTRLADLLAALLGVVVTVGAAAGVEPVELASGAGRLLDIVVYLAPPTALAFALAAGFSVAYRGRRGPWLGRLDLERALALRERPELAASNGRRAGYLSLLLASGFGFDVLLLGVWLAGPALELVRLLLLAGLGCLAFWLLRGERAPALDEPRVAGRSWVRVFADLVARQSPWLVTSVAIAAMLDANLAPESLTAAASPVVLAAVLIALALPVQVDAAAAAPVLAVLVSKGLPVPVAVATWLVVAAPGEQGLLALSKSRAPGFVARVLLATAAAGIGSLFVVEVLPFAWSPLTRAPAIERVGQLAAVLLALPVVAAIWNRGLRGWLSGVFSHGHAH